VNQTNSQIIAKSRFIKSRYFVSIQRNKPQKRPMQPSEGSITKLLTWRSAAYNRNEAKPRGCWKSVAAHYWQPFEKKIQNRKGQGKDPIENKKTVFQLFLRFLKKIIVFPRQTSK
jgi:hypothetical protein